ncbi:conjugative transposon protein TraN [Aquipluma nitroreducens]|uniref:Conjugative transposon protein TraN n=1 Tax=Aquipluma nitroreducens TaxID=2010828 RepID=A0A5K7S3N3_9BACT|nr:conjugative transposon protein TraN [Aquipluma nitroreducens]BBE16136.1 conjugative transposon protein TraN [Aquipluma nitroreducens]
MKQLLLIAAFVAASTSIKAQNNLSSENQNNVISKEISNDRIIPPYNLEVTFDKTVHVIFPTAVKYIDLGSANLIAGKAEAAENVVRIKAAVNGFENETNFSVITDEGSFYSFNVKYANEPQKLNIEMKDFIHDGSTVNRPNNSMDIYLSELANESPKVVNLAMKSIYKKNKKEIKNIESKRFGIQFLLKGIFIHNDMLYFHTEIKNLSNVSFDVNFIRWKIVDKKVAKRTAIQETVIEPVRASHFVTKIQGRSSERTVFVMNKFTIPDDKKLVVELFEKNGGRHQQFVIGNDDIIQADVIAKVK